MGPGASNRNLDAGQQAVHSIFERPVESFAMEAIVQGMPVAGDWYSIQQLDEAIFKIFEPHVVSFMRGNMFVIRGRDQCLLVDGGNGVVPLRLLLQARGLDPTIVVASHAHADHIGALHEWPLTLVHSAEAAGLAALDPNVTLAAKGYDILDISTLMTGDPDLKGAIITALPFAAFTARDYQLRAPNVRAIEDGAIIDLGDRRFQVLHLPGHCPGQIGLWDAANRVLIGGDAIYDGEPLDTLPHSNRADNRKSLQRLLELEPRVVHGGHNGAMDLQRYRHVITTYLARTA